MKLYLMQHGQARSKDTDPERSLTEQGIEETSTIAHHLFVTGKPSLSRVYHSGKTRSRQTADLVAERWHAESLVEEADDMSPMDDPSIWRGKLRTQDSDIMLVGHLPHLARLAALLLTGDPDRPVVQFAHSGIVCLERRGREGWSLLWAITPELVS